MASNKNEINEPMVSRDPSSLLWMLRKYLDWLAVHNYSLSTRRTRGDQIKQFINWCAEREVFRGADVNRKLLERYQQWLYTWRRADGQPLSLLGQAQRASSLRAFFQWLSEREMIAFNPASELELPKLPTQLPRAVLSQSEIEAVLMQPDLTTLKGIRDRAMLETLYSTGIRRVELVNLNITDLDRERGMLWVRCGKGGKDRVIPIGERALLWIDKYLAEARPRLLHGVDEGVLFLNRYGKRWYVEGISKIAHKYVEQAALEKTGACHLLRHTCATLMLEGGADIRYIQQMLGHEHLKSTQVYTKVSNRKLKEVHTQSHPGAKRSE